MCEHFDKDYDDDYEEDENLDDDCEMEKRKLYDEEDDDIIFFFSPEYVVLCQDLVQVKMRNFSPF